MKQFDLDFGKTITKLMAKENLNVDFGDYRTAYFIPSERRVCLPINFCTLSRDVLSVFAAHEDSHALNTPESFFDDAKNFPHHVLMILEDARIEHLIKDSFPGLIRIFDVGYQKLVNEADFFGLQGHGINPSELSLLDRINLTAKAGNKLIPIDYTPEEQEFLDRILAHTEYAETLELAQEYVDRFHEKDIMGEGVGKIQNSGNNKPFSENDGTPKSFENPKSGSADGDSSGKGSEKISDSDNDQSGISSNDASSGDVESEKEDTTTSNKSGGRSNGDVPPVGTTMESSNSFQESIAGGANNSKFADERNIFEIPGFSKVSQWIIPFDEINKQREKVHPEFLTQNRVKNIKNAIIKNAMLMAAEFEQKKSAHQYARRKISDMGYIDPNKLVHYRYSENIFKKATILPNAKNHGLIVFVDFSGSMLHSFRRVSFQLLVFTEFCRQVNIPYEVYGFTDMNIYKHDHTGTPWFDWDKEYKERQDANLNSYYGGGSHYLLNIFSSRMSNAEYKTAFNGYLRYSVNNSTALTSCGWETLGGTPLGEAILDSFAITDQFKKINSNVEKISTVYLTDGMGAGIRLPKNVIYKNKLFHYADEEGRHPYNRDSTINTDTSTPEAFLKTCYNECFDIDMTNVFITDYGIKSVMTNLGKCVVGLDLSMKKFNDHLKSGFFDLDIDKVEFENNNYIRREIASIKTWNKICYCSMIDEELETEEEKTQSYRWSRRRRRSSSGTLDKSMTGSKFKTYGDAISSYESLSEAFLSHNVSSKKMNNIVRHLAGSVIA